MPIRAPGSLRLCGWAAGQTVHPSGCAEEGIAVRPAKGERPRPDEATPGDGALSGDPIGKGKTSMPRSRGRARCDV